MAKIFKSRTRFYRTWDNMKKRVRVYSKHHKHYMNINVSSAWYNFDHFFNDMYDSYCKHVKKRGEENTTLERKDRLGDYCKENCIWATKKTQSNNTSRNRFLTLNGKTLSVSQWARKIGVTRQTLNNRLKKNWPLEKALTPHIPIRRYINEIIDNISSKKMTTKNREYLVDKLRVLKGKLDY